MCLRASPKMNSLTSKKFALLLLILAVNSNAVADEEKWKFTLLFPMIWAADVKGEIDVDSNLIEVDIPFSDITDSLTIGYMAEFYARKGRWVFAVKLNYLESEDEFITDEFNFPGTGIPIAPMHSIVTDQVLGTTDLIVGYQVKDSVRFFTGVRTIFTKIDLNITPLESGIIEIERKINLADETLYDWLVGADYTYRFNPRWSLILSGDVAVAGDNDKDYVGNAVLTYRFSKLNNLWIGYRYMRIKDTIIENDIDIKTDFVQQGPTIGWAFTF